MPPPAPRAVPSVLDLDRDHRAAAHGSDERGPGAAAHERRGAAGGHARQVHPPGAPLRPVDHDVAAGGDPDGGGGAKAAGQRRAREDPVRGEGVAQAHARVDAAPHEWEVECHDPTVPRWARLVPMSTPATRADGRAPDQLRPVSITRGWSGTGEGSVLIEFGATRVLCVASFTTGVPRWKRDSGEGWVTAEYAMLPRATDQRSPRESVKGRVGGRTQEISRLIGRSLRGVVDTRALGENTVTLDCDVLRADGGTRTASVTGAYIALADAVAWAKRNGAVSPGAKVLTDSVSAISVGIVDGVPVLDLPYAEDVRAHTDMNVVQTGDGRFIEVQGTAEHAPFSRAELGALLDLAALGNARLADAQRAALSGAPGERVEVAP